MGGSVVRCQAARGRRASEARRQGESWRKREICVNVQVALDVIVRSVFVTFLAPVRLERINKTLPDVSALSHDDIKRRRPPQDAAATRHAALVSSASITSPPLVPTARRHCHARSSESARKQLDALSPSKARKSLSLS